MPNQSKGKQEKVRVVQIIRGPRPQTKYKDIAAGAYAFDTTTGSITLLNGVASSTIASDLQARVGDEILLTKVRIRGTVAFQDFTVSPTLCHLALVWQKQSTGSTPALTDIYNALSSITFQKVSTMHQFEILWTWLETMGHVNDTATQATAGAPTVATIEKSITLNRRMKYSGTGGAISDITTGALWMVTLGNRAAPDGYQFFGVTRVEFTDA